MLDYYYQILEVPKGTTGDQLAISYQKVKSRLIVQQAAQDRVLLVDKAYEILSNVKVTKEKVIRKDGSVTYELKYHPNPAFYRNFYDRIEFIKAEKRRVWEKEYQGPLIWVYRFFTFFWLVIGLVMLLAPISWAYLYDSWWYLIFFTPLFYGFYYMYFKVMNWRKFRFEKNGKWL